MSIFLDNLRNVLFNVSGLWFNSLSLHLSVSLWVSVSLPVSLSLYLFVSVSFWLTLVYRPYRQVTSFPIHYHSELHTPLPQCGLSLPGLVESKKQQAGDVATVTRFYPCPWRPAGGKLKSGGVTQQTCLSVTREGTMQKNRAKASRSGRQAKTQGRTESQNNTLPCLLHDINYKGIASFPRDWAAREGELRTRHPSLAQGLEAAQGSGVRKTCSVSYCEAPGTFPDLPGPKCSCLYVRYLCISYCRD